MPAGPVRPNWPAQASTRDQNPSPHTSGLQSARTWLTGPGGLYGGGPAPSEHAAREPCHGPSVVAEPGNVRGLAALRIR